MRQVTWRPDSSSEANSSCCHRSVDATHFQYTKVSSAHITILLKKYNQKCPERIDEKKENQEWRLRKLALIGHAETFHSEP